MKHRAFLNSFKGRFKEKKINYIVMMLFQLILICITFVRIRLYEVFIDDVLINKNYVYIYIIVCGYLGCIVLDMLFQMFFINMKNKMFFGVLLNLRKKIFSYFLQENIYECMINTGDKKVRIDEDAEKVCTIYYEHKVDYYVQMVMVVSSFVLMLSKQWIMAMIAIASVPITIWLDSKLGNKEKSLNEKNRVETEKVNDWLKDDMEVWKQKKILNLYSNDKKYFIDYIQEYAKYFSKWINYWTLRALIIPEMKNEFVMKLGTYLIGGYFAMQGKMEIGTLVVFVNYYQSFIEAIQNLSNINTRIIEEYPSINRVLEVLHTSEEKRTKNNLENISIDSIDLINVNFSYDKKQDKGILEDICMSMQKGKPVIIKGESGSGKTTLLSLLIKAYLYDSGKIIINKGIDFKVIQEKDWYKKISCYMSDMALLPGTIKDNLLYVKSDASDSEIEEVLRLTEVWEMICSMPQGLGTEVLEGGSNFSGGQQQRILLARTLLKEADFYLFDEPTSALDMKLEEKIMIQLNKLAERKLVFIITHSNWEPLS